MKNLLVVLLIVLIPMWAWGDGGYRYQFEAGDTLVSATEDTSAGCFIYNGSFAETRPIRPTVYIDFTEIGTNSTHYWLQYEIDVAERNLAKSSSGWANIFVGSWRDYDGYARSAQNDMVIPLPMLESYGGKYFRVRLTYPRGVAADSTSYTLTYIADESGNMYTPAPRYFRTITHDQMWRTGGDQLCDSADVYPKTDILDLRIETTPGNFVLPTRGVLRTCEGASTPAGTSDDSLTAYVTFFMYDKESPTYIDTLTQDLNGCSELSFTLNNGTGFVEAIKIAFYNENLGNSDSTYFYSELDLEYRP